LRPLEDCQRWQEVPVLNGRLKVGVRLVMLHLIAERISRRLLQCVGIDQLFDGKSVAFQH
jgi:hypothetical protein